MKKTVAQILTIAIMAIGLVSVVLAHGPTGGGGLP